MGFSMFRFFLIALALSFFASADRLQTEKIELTKENMGAWKRHILPADDELDWMQIPWLTTFADGIVSANKQDKPLLLWVMNGHPLGCT